MDGAEEHTGTYGRDGSLQRLQRAYMNEGRLRNYDLRKECEEQSRGCMIMRFNQKGSIMSKWTSGNTYDQVVHSRSGGLSRPGGFNVGTLSLDYMFFF